VETLKEEMMSRVIKTDAEYRAVLGEVEKLAEHDPEVGTEDGDRLELLTLLVQEYELRKYGEPKADPIEAIIFRMEQQNMNQRDLVPYLGSRSRVSEVLARKRPLTLSMMRALHSGLGIPARALLQEQTTSDKATVEWNRFPLQEMISRGWIDRALSGARLNAEVLGQAFFAQLGSSATTFALYRQSQHVRSARSMDRYALTAWTVRILIRARHQLSLAEYKTGVINSSFMREVAKLSYFENGPRLAQEYLLKHGIPLIIEPHLTHTFLDGAAIHWHDRPIIGLTLRHDRLDNFWFCLMHELAHVALHLSQGVTGFYDDLDLPADDDPREQQADELAGEVLIPREEWEKSPARRVRSRDAVLHLAERLKIHPSIVAGRMRYEFRSYRVLNQFVGHGLVRGLFPEIEWG